MNTPLTLASRQTLSAQIISLDLRINKLTKLFNSISFKGGSLMLSGKTELGRELHELIVWDSKDPLPRTRIKEFLQIYCQDLIYQRAVIINLLENGQVEFKDQHRVATCSNCCRHTTQRNFYILPGKEEDGSTIAIPAAADTWICNECELIMVTVTVNA